MRVELRAEARHDLVEGACPGGAMSGNYQPTLNASPPPSGPAPVERCLATTNAMPPPLHIANLSIAPPVLAAPMAGFSNFAFRSLVRRLGGAGLLFTEMLSARGLQAIDARGEEPPGRLWGAAEEPRPLGIQIWDNDPGTLAAAARRLVEQFAPSLIDLNFGCPARDVAEKAQSGAYLLRRPDRVGELVARVAAACPGVPVTAKIRLGPSARCITAADVARAVEEAGGAALTVHGRTTDQLFRGRADWEQIARVKPHLRRIPLIGNGDLKTAEDVVAAFARYGVDGVMIGRAGLGRPWLFRAAAAALRGEPVPPEPGLSEQRDLLLAHYRMLAAQHGAARAAVHFRREAARYAHGRPGARAFRDDISRVASPEEVAAVVDRHFAAAASP